MKIHCGKGYNRDNYYCELTLDLDKRLIESKKNEYFNNYIYKFSFDTKQSAIRFPGATRGCIYHENGIITNIKIYDDSNCYIDGTEDFLSKKYVGIKLKEE